MFGIDPEKIEVMPEATVMPNSISDEEIEQIAGPYGPAMQKRLREAAILFNIVIYINHVDTPWRQLLEEFRDDLERTSSLQPLTLPDGSQQMVLVDGGKLPGNPELREGLWKLHETLEEIENYQAKDFFNEELYREAQRRNAQNDRIKDENEKIKDRLRAEYMPAKHGSKGKIKKKIANDCFVSERHLDTFISEIKKEDSR